MKKPADRTCRLLIQVIVVLSFMYGIATYLVMRFATPIAWSYRNATVGGSVIRGQLLALAIYAWFYMCLVPFAHSIETAASDYGPSGTVAAFRVNRFKQLLFSRVALFLTPSLICFGSITIIAVQPPDEQRRSCAPRGHQSLFCMGATNQCPRLRSLSSLDTERSPA